MPEPNLSFRKDPNRLKDIRDIVVGITDPTKSDPKASKAIVERALSLSNIPDTADQDDYTTNAHRSWTELNDLRAQFTQNIPLRNAEYYLMGYYAGLSHDAWLSFGVDFGDAYMALKWAARKNSFSEAWIRSDPDVPSSPPGGTEWAQRGLGDGRVLRDTWTNTSDAKKPPLSYPAE
jgi:hypothetical protein